MGLLVFGTPTLLLFGYDFSQTLGMLLPSSMAISVMQVAQPGIPRPAIPRELFKFCLPAICAAMLFSILYDRLEHAALLVGTVLLLSAIARLVPFARNLLTVAINTNSAIYHIIMGVVHGLTNLGGAMLAVFAANQYSQKSEVCYIIAGYYLAFGLLQCSVLAFTGHTASLLQGVMVIPIAILTFFAVGRPLFRRLQDRQYDGAMSVFIMAYGIVLLIKSAG